MRINTVSFTSGILSNFNYQVRNNSETSFGEKQYNEAATCKLQKLWHEKRQNNFWHKVKEYINAGADPNIKYEKYFNGCDKTLLHDAAKENNSGMVEFLIKHGADIHAEEGMNDYTPYDIAAKNNAVEALAIFVKHDSSIVNSINFHHETPLMVATKSKSYKAMEFLLRNKANPDIYNENKNRYAFNYAFENQDIKGMIILLEHGAKAYIDAEHLPFDDMLFSPDWIGHYYARETYENAVKRYHSSHQRPSVPNWVCGLVTPYRESDYKPLPSYEDVRSHLSDPSLAGE